MISIMITILIMHTITIRLQQSLLQCRSPGISHGMDAVGCETRLPTECGGVFTEAVESEACSLPSNILANLPKAFPHI